MRTTLDIDDDILQTVKELAAVRQSTAGRVISELARTALSSDRPIRTRNGVPVLPRRARGDRRTTMRLVNDLRDGDGATAR
ncbi:MAG: CopG family transcriptional regulator [Acidimicrobiaceae bacterium]|nr:CopG family transcriptional regulator [Acidimicrobiaceae bacterium]|tara:strand:- start:130 stop:372 length:243 start_codon:yes stop_codon:yes gene_type:complete